MPEQTVVELELAVTLGVTAGVIEIVTVDAFPLPHVFVGVTETAPPVLAKVAVILLVPDPEVIVAPEGNVQLYEVAPVTEAILYVTPVCPLHTAVRPVIEPAADGPVQAIPFNTTVPSYEGFVQA